jgi:hypothetical protein
MQVGIHEVEYEIDVSIVLCPYNILKPNDVLMTIELLKEDDLSEGPLGVRCVLEGIEVLL